MSSVVEIEQAVASLSSEEFVAFAQWFDAERNRKWDRQIEADARNGKLRAAFERLQSENQGEADTPLNEVLDQKKLP